MPILYQDCKRPEGVNPCPVCGRLPAAMQAVHADGTTRKGLYCATPDCLPYRAVWADTSERAIARWNAGEMDTADGIPDGKKGGAR